MVEIKNFLLYVDNNFEGCDFMITRQNIPRRISLLLVFQYGYVEALYYLSSEYPSTVYSDAWRTLSPRSNLSDVIHSLLQQEFIYDINCHVHVLHLCGNLLSGTRRILLYVNYLEIIRERLYLFVGRCVESLSDTHVDPETTRRLIWGIFGEKRLQGMCESFLTHLVKLLNILVHIIDDVPLATDQKPTTALTSITVTASSSSPVKSRKSSDGEKNVEKKTATDGQSEGGEKNSDRKSEPSKAAGMGHFSNSPHYVKIYDVLKIAYEKYKVILSISSKLLRRLNVCLFLFFRLR